MAILVLLNNFLHDFSAAGWVFGTVLLWFLMRKENPGGDAGKIIADTLKTVLRLMQLSFAGIVVFGVFRTLAYRKYEWNVAAGEDQVTLIIIKHIIFTAIFVVGLICYIKARRVVKKSRVEKPE